MICEIYSDVCAVLGLQHTDCTVWLNNCLFTLFRISANNFLLLFLSLFFLLFGSNVKCVRWREHTDDVSVYSFAVEQLEQMAFNMSTHKFSKANEQSSSKKNSSSNNDRASILIGKHTHLNSICAICWVFFALLFVFTVRTAIHMGTFSLNICTAYVNVCNMHMPCSSKTATAYSHPM